MPVRFQTKDSLAPQERPAAFHGWRLDHRHAAPGGQASTFTAMSEASSLGRSICKHRSGSPRRGWALTSRRFRCPHCKFAAFILGRRPRGCNRYSGRGQLAFAAAYGMVQVELP
jgi:hypothetical protein